MVLLFIEWSSHNIIDIHYLLDIIHPPVNYLPIKTMIEFAPEEYCIELNWHDAKLYCFSLNIDGKTGWRLPTFDEFAEWIANSEYAGIQEFNMRDYTSKINFCWTSTENNNHTSSVKVHCDEGIIYSIESKDHIRLTKPARSIS